MAKRVGEEGKEEGRWEEAKEDKSSSYCRMHDMRISRVSSRPHAGTPSTTGLAEAFKDWTGEGAEKAPPLGRGLQLSHFLNHKT